MFFLVAILLCHYHLFMVVKKCCSIQVSIATIYSQIEYLNGINVNGDWRNIVCVPFWLSKKKKNGGNKTVSRFHIQFRFGSIR